MVGMGAATIVGGGVGYLAKTTGLLTGLHEYVGHGYMGGHLTRDYSSTSDPVYQVDGWDNFQALLDADGGTVKAEALGKGL